MANNKIKFEDDCGGLKPLPLVKKKKMQQRKSLLKVLKRKSKGVI